MGLFDQFPYTNFHELNLDWVLQALKELEHNIEEFVSINALKYADPIQWDITSQYEKNTIVIDPQTGTAYISVKPVPIGVALTDANYWTVVFNLEQFITKANTNFTPRVENNTTLNATFSTNSGQWLIWNGELYQAISNIIAGDQYVINSNIKRITVEDITGNLPDLSTTDKSNLVAAINEVLVTLISTTGDLSNLNTTDKSNLVAAINEVNDNISVLSTKFDFITPEQFGAVGDGMTDDSNALIACFSSNELDEKYIKLRGTYLLTKRIVVQSNTVVKGGGVGTILDRYDITGQTTFLTRATFALNMIDNVVFDGVILRGSGAVSSYIAKYLFLMQNSSHIYFKNCKMYDYPGVSFIYARDSENIWVDHCYMKDYSRGAIQFVEGTSFSGVLFTEIADGHETNTDNRYPLMLNGYDQVYDADNMGKQGLMLFAIGNYIHDTDPWWEGIDAHGGSYIFVAYNRLQNVASGIAIFSSRSRGFIAYEVHVHDNEVEDTLSALSNSGNLYGNSFGGSRMFIHHNRFRNGGRAYPSDNGAAIYFDRGYDVFFNNNVVDNGYGSCLFFSGEFNNFYIDNNELAHAANGAGADPAIIKFNDNSVTLYIMLIRNNSFAGGAPIVKAPASKTTTNQMIKLENNCYSLSSPTFVNIEYVKPDKATAAQIALSACGENGDICWNVAPTVGQPIGWIMTNSSHAVGTWRALPNLT